MTSFLGKVAGPASSLGVGAVWLAAGIGLLLGAATTWGQGKESGAAPAGPPGGKEGRLVGVWERTDADKKTSLFEFRADGSCRRPDRQIPDRAGTAQYVHRDGLLSFGQLDKSRKTFQIDERGKVEWLDKDLFKFTVVDGAWVRDTKGQVYTFRRVEAKGKAGALVGLWTYKEKNLKRFNGGTVEFDLDGSVDHAYFDVDFRPALHQSAIYGASSVWTYQYSDPKLNILVRAGGPRSVRTVLEGTVAWLDENLFEFKVARNNLHGFHENTVYVFSRQSRKPAKDRQGKFPGGWLIREGTELIAKADISPDGTFKGKGFPGAAVFGNRIEYTFKDGIFSLVQEVGRSRQRLVRGAVEWVGKNQFELTLLDGSEITGTRHGKVLVFQRGQE